MSETDLLQGYEFLEEKTIEALHELAARICENYGITENVDNIKRGLVARLIRQAGKSPELKGINIAFVRENGFDLMKLHNSIHFGECKKSDWPKLRKIIEKARKLNEREKLAEAMAECPDLSKLNSSHKYYVWVMKYKRRFSFNAS